MHDVRTLFQIAGCAPNALWSTLFFAKRANSHDAANNLSNTLPLYERAINYSISHFGLTLGFQMLKIANTFFLSKEIY